MPSGTVTAVTEKKATITHEKGSFDVDRGNLQQGDEVTFRISKATSLPTHVKKRAAKRKVTDIRDTSNVTFSNNDLQNITEECRGEKKQKTEEKKEEKESKKEEKKEEEKEEKVSKSLCCKEYGTFIEKLDTKLASESVASMLRACYEAARKKKMSPWMLCFEISFFIHSYDEVCKCEKKTLDNLVISWIFQDLTGVAACHPTALKLATVLGSDKPKETKGTIALEKSNAKTMEVHVKTCIALIDSLTKNQRGFWVISACGHSFSLIRRGKDEVEIIDAFANDRGIGVWTLSLEELGKTDHVPVEKKKNSPTVELIAADTGVESSTTLRPLKLHVPPRKRFRTIKEVTALLVKMVSDNFITRSNAQLELVNYPFEPESGEDALPGATFGYQFHELKSDDELLDALASAMFHAVTRWKPDVKKKM